MFGDELCPELNFSFFPRNFESQSKFSKIFTMSIISRILEIPGISTLIADFVFDPNDMAIWHLDPPSFYPIHQCPHALSEGLCRKILITRIKCRLNSELRWHFFRVMENRVNGLHDPNRYYRYFSKRKRNGKYVNHWCKTAYTQPPQHTLKHFA